MLRTSYMNKFNKSSKYNSLYEFDNKQIIEDDKFVLESNRPLREQEIMKIGTENLEKFVHSVLTDRKMNNILFSSTAKSEIKSVIKSSSSMNFFKKKELKKIKGLNPQDMVHRRARKEAIGKIEIETKDYKRGLKKENQDLKINNFNFYKEIIEEKTKYESMMKNYTLEYRIKRFNEIINSIKNKINESGIKLPNIELDINDVFSRLYFNAVNLGREDGNNRKETIDSKMKESILSRKGMELNNSKYSLNIKNVIQGSNGKQFTLKITDYEFTQCYTMHSGGPRVRFKRKKLENNHNKNLDLISAVDEFGNSFLHLSVIEDQVELVYYFLIKGLIPNSQNKEGDTPLHLAMKSKNKDMIKLLLDHGADVNICNLKKESPYDHSSFELKKQFQLDYLYNLNKKHKNQ